MMNQTNISHIYGRFFSMNRMVLMVLFMTLALVSGSAYAQQTGGLTADNLFQYLNKQQAVKAEKIGRDRVTIHSQHGGAEVCSVRFEQPQVVTITQPIARLDIRSQAAARVMSAMATFNFSSPVGTLLLDDATGMLRMEHHLNPYAMNVETMASVVLLFGQVAENESRHFAALIGKDMGMRMR